MTLNANISYGKSAILVSASYCSSCILAKAIILDLIAEGYNVRIEDIKKHKNVKYVPTLIIKSKHHIGCKTEAEYRKLLRDYAP